MAAMSPSFSRERSISFALLTHLLLAGYSFAAAISEGDSITAMRDSVEDYRIIESLEELAKNLGIKVRHEPINPDEELPEAVGGLCRFKGEYVLIVNPNAPASEQIKTFVEALKSFELDQLYIKPALRELLDGDLV